MKLNRSADESTLEEGTELPEESAVVAETQVEPPPEPGQLQKLQAELENLPQIGKRLAIHLEQGVRADLLQLCDRQEITPETFFKAAYALIQDNPKLVEEIVTEAKQRLKQRKRAGLIRRTLSMMDTCRQDL